MTKITKSHWERLAKKMIQEQLVFRGIHNPDLLKAMEQVPRHLFVSENYLLQAYEDRPLPIGEGQTISQPYIVALMSELVMKTEAQNILEIGTGCGYQTAILAHLFAQVFSIERIRYLHLKGKNNLKKMNLSNVHLKLEDGYQGWQEHSPYDAILISCAPETIPKKLVAQLKIGGKIITPVGERGCQDLLEITKESEKKLDIRKICAVSFVPMLHNTEGD